MTDDDAGKVNVRTLATIARALAMPLEAFFDPVARDPAALFETEEAELLRLFREICDPQRRSHCLTLIRDMAGLPYGEIGDP